MTIADVQRGSQDEAGCETNEGVESVRHSPPGFGQTSMQQVYASTKVSRLPAVTPETCNELAYSTTVLQYDRPGRREMYAESVTSGRHTIDDSKTNGLAREHGGARGVLRFPY